MRHIRVHLLHRQAFVARILSPMWLLERAAILGLIFFICHIARLREHTAFLSGGAAPDGGLGVWEVLLGGLYVLAYLGVVLVAPILTIAAGAVAIWQWISPDAP